MHNDTQPVIPMQEPSRQLAGRIQHWTREVGRLRIRARRLAAPVGVDPSPAQRVLEDAVAMCTEMLQDLAGADLQIEKAAARAASDRQEDAYLFDRLPLPCVGVDAGSRITRANRAAALLLNLSVRHLIDQPLWHFSQDRETFMELLQRMRHESGELRGEVSMRPRDRRTATFRVTIVPKPSSREWLWFLQPERIAEPRAVQRERQDSAQPLLSQPS